MSPIHDNKWAYTQYAMTLWRKRPTCVPKQEQYQAYVASIRAGCRAVANNLVQVDQDTQLRLDEISCRYHLIYLPLIATSSYKRSINSTKKAVNQIKV